MPLCGAAFTLDAKLARHILGNWQEFVARGGAKKRQLSALARILVMTSSA